MGPLPWFCHENDDHQRWPYRFHVSWPFPHPISACITVPLSTAPEVLWLIHTALDRERERDREWDRERWVYVFCYVLFTLHRDRERERGPLGSIPIFPFPVSVPFPCSVNEPLDVSLKPSLPCLSGNVLCGFNTFDLHVHLDIHLSSGGDVL